ncbi:EAL domain-containing protein [Endozoicomonas sp. G2_1]|uniref:bifunctional diguanylate cyclase/phosphodiesterase n=1 Tax=Endozoicomonas sp. G2_1 TaxID=2821091 RepID=UPI001ADB16F8|nr:EAL domain-containing protein [Endozoicomonas sp. G2_1]MBO9491262.1 EAL domain-containing protein [Endozoicomonas sp. G2_1]
MPAILSRYKSLVFTFIVGIALSCAAFSTINFYQHKQIEQQFTATFSDKVTGLRKAIIAIEKVLIASQHLITISPDLTRQQFSQLVDSDLLANTSIQGIEWAPKVATAEQSQFRQNMQASGIFDYRLRFNKQPSNCHLFDNTLFPVAYAEPAERLGDQLGIVLSSYCDLSQTMALADQTNKISSLNFVNQQQEAGVRLFLPVKPEQSLQGFIVGHVMINHLIDNLWADLRRSEHYQLTIKDNSQTALYNSSWLANCLSDDCPPAPAIFTKQTQIPFTNQLWTIEFTQTELQLSNNYYAYIAAFLLLTITSGLAYYLYTSINRIAWANQLVEERTVSLQHQASHDQLTGLLNKSTLFNQLDLLTKHQDKTFEAFGLLFIDLDHFKRINDSMGHVIGDQLLQQVADTLINNSRSGDDLFRFGGDEFVIILQKLAHQEKINHIAQRYLKALQQPFEIEGYSYRINASIGASVINTPNSTPEEIVRNADIAMYQAKDAGRGQVTFLHKHMHEQIVAEYNLVFDLERAIKAQEFELHYQPIVNHHYQLVGFEALVRWQHPTRGLVMPFDFIHLAESSGLIQPLGKTIAKLAIAQLAMWRRRFSVEHCPYISINVSARQLINDDIIDLIEQELGHYQLSPHLLVVELTESALIDSKSKVKAQLTRLNQLGVKLYLDDFGTGYSSLSMLQDFPIDVVKIDRSFISALDQPTKAAQGLVKAIISMAKALDMAVVAEGIEQQQTIDWLIDHGCTAFQGYYFAKPLAPLQLQTYLKAHKSESTKAS